MTAERGARIHVSGVVQGVGFRPFVYGLAVRHALRGWVRNTSGGVDIAVEGDPDGISTFLHTLRTSPPPLARLEAVTVAEAAPTGCRAFEIHDSVSQPGAFQPVSPDMALCAACERELFDPADRRYLYPFINCTHCGPRFTIIRDLPYDRPATTMDAFPLCGDCAREYADPLDRRFHAQPVACPECGPEVWLAESRQPSALSHRRLAILDARRRLSLGQIVAVKGLGGFHLACDAANARAVAELRRRKGRAGKPLALMADSIATIETLCEVSDDARALLTGREKPIVLLPRRASAPVAAETAPRVNTLGVMLPYTPLHHLLLNQTDPVLAGAPAPRVLVMTSGNFSEEPIAIANDDALERLAPLADAFLLHNRGIQQRCDDSVVRVLEHSERRPARRAEVEEGGEGGILFLRRSRGYAPYPVRLPFDTPQILAVGGELKNTFCLTRERSAFLSQHIGDMENAETLESFEANIELLTRLFRITPEVVAHDLHPDYLSTRWARRAPFDGPRLGIQHHHAHIAACLADNGLPGDEPVIGLAFDGTGCGLDGAIWGGEILIADYKTFTRAARLEYLPLPGGDAAIRHPWRIALGYAAALGLEVEGLPFMDELDPHAVKLVRAQIAKGLNTIRTSSMGRLFDAVAVLAGARGEAAYEAQAAIELEAAAAGIEGPGVYPFGWDRSGGERILRVGPLLRSVIADVRRGQSTGQIGARFHRTLITMLADLCRELRAETGLKGVALSGGVWQNVLLLNGVTGQLRREGFTVYTHRHTPANDGGLALGQAAIAARSQ